MAIGSDAAERYAAAARRRASAALESFQALYDFPLDDFQLEACRALEDGHGVLVAAPTGSGKTLVGEFAVHLALAEGRKCFYTTPIKALSNQKYADLVRRYGADAVGLLTGDNTINGDAAVVVMTTEVLRNMLYASSPTLRGLGYVVMDEVHYLADRFRGGVWEEVIIHLSESVRLVSLSATVSNAEEFADWLVTVRGETKVIVEEHRPIPLWQHMLVAGRMYDLFIGDTHELKVNPELLRAVSEQERRGRSMEHGRNHGRDRRPRRHDTPSRVDVIERLDAEGLLPAITFIFSRAGCDGAVVQCVRSNLRLNTPSEAAEVRALVEERTTAVPDEDLHVLGYHEWLEGLERGVAAHHAGMLPTFKEVVEELFTRGLVKAVFATETLALGINMPARTVVLERLVKWNGEAHADITPGEYTQLTGRAGRRGIDVEGHAVVLWTPGLDPAAVAGLASTRTYPLRSSFRPSYNMAVNLVGQVGRDKARVLLESSFAQFQADRAVVGLARQIQKNTEALEGYRDAMTCHLGDFEEYATLRRRLSDVEAESARSAAALRRAAAAASLERLKPGDVVRIPAGRRAGLAIVLDPGLQPGNEGARPVVLTEERQVKRLSIVDFPSPVEPLERMRIPKSFNARNSQDRRELAITLRNRGIDAGGEGTRHRKGAGQSDEVVDEIVRLRAELRRHPCHGCADREQHARWAERYWRLRRDTDALERRVENRTNSIARVFDRVCDLLGHLGYLEGETVTPAGRRLARLYGELDLVAAECLQGKLWHGLPPAELAACVSALVFEAREPETAPPRLPRGNVADVLDSTMALWARLAQAEHERRLDFLREPSSGFVWAAYRWASGASLDAVLTENALSAGDFVRWIRQLLDLLGQIAVAADDEVRTTAEQAMDALRRGVVAYSSIG
ncbi:MAG: ATP-dependent helicase HelY [Actinomycetota bacterium]|nr:ATP-dependent helicase HelY [Actinomycetota bacterium]